jgi:hypothetical protein
MSQEPRHLTPTERLHEVTMTALSRGPSLPECSVTISRNAKQDIQFEVVVRGPSVTDCNLLAQYEADLLAAKYPAGGAVSPQETPPTRIEPLDFAPPARASRRRRKAPVAS